MSYYPQEVIDEIRSLNNIVDVVGQYVKLKKSGSSYVGLCPFHNEKTPSFHVNAERQFYHCFGCGAGGDVFGFTMKYGNYSYPDAVRVLADRVGYIIPETEMPQEVAKRRELKQNLYEIHKIAARFYYSELMSNNGKRAVEYLDKREVTLGARRKFGLGYSPIARGALYNELKKKGFSDEIILESGLVTKRDNGQFYDKFFNRLMFPIIDVYGNIIGFGGRELGEGMPKYLNSPETPIFSKSNNLYNLNNAKNSKSREFILVEGYMDAIAIYQAGFHNVVASLGTAFNQKHSKVLKAYADSVILLFDSDSAGVNAVLKAIPVLKEAGLKVRVVQVYDSKDPDEFIKKFGAVEFGELLSKAKNHIIFQAEQYMKGYDLNNLDDKIAFSKDIAKLISDVDSPIERNAYLSEISKISQIDLEAIQSEILNINNGIQVPRLSTRAARLNKSAVDSARAGLVSILTGGEMYYRVISKYVKPEEFVDEFYIKTVERIYELYSQGKTVSKENVIGFFETVEEQSRITKLFVQQIDYMDVAEKTINDFVKIVKEAYCDDMMRKAIEQNITSIDRNALINAKININRLNISLTDG